MRLKIEVVKSKIQFVKWILSEKSSSTRNTQSIPYPFYLKDDKGKMWYTPVIPSNKVKEKK